MFTLNFNKLQHAQNTLVLYVAASKPYFVGARLTTLASGYYQACSVSQLERSTSREKICHPTCVIFRDAMLSSRCLRSSTQDLLGLSVERSKNCHRFSAFRYVAAN